MDAWRVRESVDFLSLASGRRDGEVGAISGVFGDPEKAGAKLNVSNLAVIQRAATVSDRLDLKLPWLTGIWLPNRTLFLITHRHARERTPLYLRKLWNKDACMVAGIRETTFCHWLQCGETAKSGRFMEFLESLKRPGRSSMSRTSPSSNGPRPERVPTGMRYHADAGVASDRSDLKSP